MRTASDDAVEHLEAELTAARALIRALVDSALDAVIVIDGDGIIESFNPAAERMFGRPAAEAVGRELAAELVPERFRDAHRRGLRDAVAGGAAPILSQRVELSALRPDGTEFPVELVVTRQDGPGPPHFTGHVRDMTERVQADRRLVMLAEEQAALKRVATVVATEPDTGRVLARVTEEIGRYLGAQTANLVRFDPDGGGTVVAGWNDPWVEVGERVRLHIDSDVARVARSGRPVRVDDWAQEEGEIAEWLVRIGFRASIAAPVRIGGRLWGTVTASLIGGKDAFGPGTEHRMEEFAELVAEAIANAEAREQLAASRARLVAAGDAERKRLERNLHDGAQQRLVGLALMLRIAESRLDTEPEAVPGLLATVHEELRAALTELRELARGLHPAVLSERGLEVALRGPVARAGLPVTLRVALEERLPLEVEVAAYFLVCEALANVAKHARAERAEVAVGLVSGWAVVSVADNGRGGAGQGVNMTSTGLRGLQDRIEALGGRLSVDSPPGEGTRLQAEIPVSPGLSPGGR